MRPCESGSSSTLWRLVIKQKLMGAPAYHRASKPEQANSLLRRLLWVTFALLIGASWSWFTEFARPSSVADRCFESIVVKALEHTWVKRHQTIDFQEMPGIFEARARTACVDACACMCGPPVKLLQRFASKVDSWVKTFARQASKKARMQLGCGELVLAMVGQQRGDAHVDLDASLGSVLLEASPLQSVRRLHIASHSFSPWQSGFSEMDAEEKLEEEPVNLLGEMKLKVMGKFFTRVQMAQSVDLAATRWVGCLYEVMFSQTPWGEFRPNELRVKKRPATMGLL